MVDDYQVFLAYYVTLQLLGEKARIDSALHKGPSRSVWHVIYPRPTPWVAARDAADREVGAFDAAVFAIGF